MAQIALVVDDSMLIRHTICRYFEEHGFVVESAANVPEAIESLKRVHPTIIVTDMQMPAMSGSEFITFLKSQAVTAGIPVIIVAGRQCQGAPEEKRADFMIHKDIDIENQLSIALKQLLGSTSTKHASAP